MFTNTQPPPEVLRYDDGRRRLLLRRSQLCDLPQLADGVLDSLPELRQFMPWAHMAGSSCLEAQTQRCQTLIQLWDVGRDFAFNLFVRQADGSLRFAGCLGLHPRCLANHGLEIGYWVRSDCTGQGLCTLAVKMAVLAGFQAIGLKRIQVGCDVANEGSRRVIEKVGFISEGIQRNMGEVDPPFDAVERGWRGIGNTASYALIPTDLERLDWPDSVARHLHFESL